MALIRKVGVNIIFTRFYSCYEGHKIEAIDLTNDHRLTCEEEKKRIIAAGVNWLYDLAREVFFWHRRASAKTRRRHSIQSICERKDVPWFSDVTVMAVILF